MQAHLKPSNLFQPSPPSPIERFIHNPIKFLVTWIYTHQSPIAPLSAPASPKVKVVCISDTHNEKPEVPDGDILIHAGDLTKRGTYAEIQAQLDWLSGLPHTYKVVVGGNHDLLLDSTFIYKVTGKFDKPVQGQMLENIEWSDIIYLNNGSADLVVRDRHLSIFGSPMSPKHADWVFQYPRDVDVWKKMIPKATDIVVTHCPPRGHLSKNGLGIESGCEHLLRELWRVKPKLAVWGHIHEGRGRENVCWDRVQRAYDEVNRSKNDCLDVSALFSKSVMIVMSVLMWIWGWISWTTLGRKRVGKGSFVNAAIVGKWGIAKGRVVEI